MTDGQRFFQEASATVISSVHDTMNRVIEAVELSTPQRIALACRHLADEGHARTLAGQISVKNDDGSFWTTNFATGFAEARASNLVRVDESLALLEGDGMANPATRFHMWVYDKRPDVRAIVHTHPPHASALAISGEPLVVAHMDMMMFHDDVAMLRHWPGVPLANEEGRLISEAIGDKNSILLANHGLLTAGRSLEFAVFLAGHLEYAAQVQLLCKAAGYDILPVADELAQDAKRFVTSPKFVEATFDYWCRQIAQRHPDALD